MAITVHRYHRFFTSKHQQPGDMCCLSAVLNVKAELSSTREIERFKIELENTGFANAPYDNVVFTFHPSFASQYLLAVGNWDESRRNSVRKFSTRLGKTSTGIRVHGGLYRLYWYDDCLEKCGFNRPHVLTLYCMFPISEFHAPSLVRACGCRPFSTSSLFLYRYSLFCSCPPVLPSGSEPRVQAFRYTRLLIWPRTRYDFTGSVVLKFMSSSCLLS